MNKNLMLLLGLTITSTFIYFDNNLLKVSKYKVKSKKIPREFNNFKLMHLSDLHSKSFGKDNSKLIKKIYMENPNIIVMTGDMVNKYDTEFDEFLRLAEELSKKYAIYYIVGNHEQRLKKDNLIFLINQLRKLGIRVLNNEKIKLIKGEEFINLYGMSIPLLYYKVGKNKVNFREDTMKELLGNYNDKNYSILLTHNPLYFDTYAKYNVDLTLCGHVHGGMIRLPFIGAILSPERKFFPKYNSGEYEINKKKLIVSRGIGHSMPGIRILNRPEIVIITLSLN
ncbi:metallophosphoesterase [Clostridium uliginosum]|uniref:Calcineurin-like phosphoesterase domain-containing protein n=1 Tax=Clostridium uliginosum TaxID=119641 RepID=A0A1I1GY52_9CLOT|nr:metallophosphoesterase [Clostridium uliginosum]SFC16212.1 hypothetical protein SAMN05421842_10193 [Clostridium uliginosum]